MIIIKPSFEILTPKDQLAGMLVRIETAGRVCYKSEGKTTETSAPDFIRRIIQRGHESVLEHEIISVRFICDRGISHECVRHRLASYSQESTRYCSSVTIPRMTAESEDDIAELYQRGFSMRKVAEMSSGKYKEWEVYKILDSRGIERRSLGNHGLRKQDVFRLLDTPEKAYLMGVFISDGSIRQDLSQVTVTQHQDFSWYLRALLREMLGGEIGCSKDKDCHQLSFAGIEIGKDLFDKGLIPNKTYNTTFADAERLKNSIPTNLIPDFLRGLMDGDGCIRFFRQRGEQSLHGSAHLDFSGHRLVMELVADWVKNLIGYEINVRDEKQSFLSRATISSRDAVVDLCRIMYRDFKMPWGHPKKTVRVYEELTDLPFSWATWGDPKFQVILPEFAVNPFSTATWIWANAMDDAERTYYQLRTLGWTPQQARSVLPNSLKTELVMTANLREWRHFFRLRTSTAAHPQMRELTIPLLAELKTLVPVIFEDIT